MKRICIFLSLLVSFGLNGQTQQAFKNKYDKQVRVVGTAGVGVEYILDSWAEAFPDDTDMLEGRFLYFFSKGQTTQVVPKKYDKFLGKKPVITLKDSTGVSVNYFEETFFVDSLFALSASAIDRAISLCPSEFSYRVDKITALISYEKESPDMATSEIVRLIDYNNTAKPSWTYCGNVMDPELFDSTIQEYCYNLFQFGMPGTMEAFRTISEKMISLHPKNVDYLNNMGSYWLVGKKDNRQALKYYNKALKIDPKNYSAAKNCVLLARKDKNEKLEKKYLPLLIAATESDTERLSCEARLKALSK